MDKKEIVKKHAARYVCPSGSEPQTPYEVNMINNLILFGNELLDAALEAEAATVRAEAYKVSQEIADAIVLNYPIDESGYDAAKTISNLISIEVRRAQKDAATQPETEAGALTFENLNASTT